jgi:hypothetical protein
MAAGRRDEGGDEANEVVVHVAWIAQCGGGGRHDCGDLTGGGKERANGQASTAIPGFGITGGCKRRAWNVF